MPLRSRPSLSRSKGPPLLSPPPNVDERQRTYTIGALAAEFGVTLRALRFYEAKGLLKPRRRGTTRFYTPADRAQLATILKGKELGFSLREIRAMLSDQASSAAGAIHVPAEMIAAQIAQLEAEQAKVERALATLRACAIGPQGDPAHHARSLVERVNAAFGGGQA